jgi:large subunit ribosomal protein L9
MEIILIKDVEKLGYADDVVNVKPGYALNYLIPQGFAVVKSAGNLKELDNRRRGAEKREAKMLSQINDIKARIEASKLSIGAKVGTTGKIFGSVSNYHVAEALKNTARVDVDRRKISIEEGEVKSVGTYHALINLHKDHQVRVPFEVVGE